MIYLLIGNKNTFDEFQLKKYINIIGLIIWICELTIDNNWSQNESKYRLSSNALIMNPIILWLYD